MGRCGCTHRFRWILVLLLCVASPCLPAQSGASAKSAAQDFAIQLRLLEQLFAIEFEHASADRPIHAFA